MAEKKKAAPKKKATPKEKTPAWSLVQDEGCWVVLGKNRHHFDSKEQAQAFIDALNS